VKHVCSGPACRCWLPVGRCAVEVAAEGPRTIEEVAELLGESFQAVKWLEPIAIRRFRTAAKRLGLDIDLRG
jgi:hypothetical protein